MTPAIRQAIRSALDMPLLSERKCEAVYKAVLEGVMEPSEEMIARGKIHDPLGCDIEEDDAETVYGAIWRGMMVTLLRSETVSDV